MKTNAGETIASASQADASVFSRWAQVYDAQSNPLLLLEERRAAPLLPPVRGGNVLDVGCGTGRWLTRLEALHPDSLTGIDCSMAMLSALAKRSFLQRSLNMDTVRRCQAKMPRTPLSWLRSC